MSILSFIPIFNEDIFLKYRPFPAEADNLFIKHWHEIFASFVIYTFIEKMSPLVCSSLVGSQYTSLPKKTKVNFDIHVVAMLQCLFSIAILLPMWNHPYWQESSTNPESGVLGYYPYGGFVSAVTIGYFIWDLYVCLVNFSLFGVGFLFHAVAALIVFCSCMYPFCMPWIPGFLLFELSSPFVNINWFASKIGCFNETVVIVNGILLLVTFFSVRIVWGFYAVYMVATDMSQVWDMLPNVLPTIILSLNFMLNVLNIYWFYKMVMIAKKKASGKKSTKSAAKEVTKID